MHMHKEGRLQSEVEVQAVDMLFNIVIDIQVASPVRCIWDMKYVLCWLIEQQEKLRCETGSAYELKTGIQGPQQDSITCQILA